MRLAGCDLGVVVGPTGALTHAYLGERDDVQREVELPITTAWQTVSRVVAAGDLDRCDAGIAGERAAEVPSGSGLAGSSSAVACSASTTAAGLLRMISFVKASTYSNAAPISMNPQ